MRTAEYGYAETSVGGGFLKIPQEAVKLWNKKIRLNGAPGVKSVSAWYGRTGGGAGAVTVRRGYHAEYTGRVGRVNILNIGPTASTCWLLLGT